MIKTPVARAAIVLAVALTAIPALADATGLTTVFLVRHAEKESGGSDPALAGAGLERARELARVLGDGGIDAVYTSQFKRTRDTASPLAQRLGVTATVVPVEAGGVEHRARELARRILTEHAGQRVLVIGHSNTLPQLIAALGLPAPTMDETKDYDDLFEVVVAPSGTAALVHLHYGQPTP